MIVTKIVRTAVVALADRNKGVGCDQILTIEAPRTPGAAASYRIWNADGSAGSRFTKP